MLMSSVLMSSACMSWFAYAHCAQPHDCSFAELVASAAAAAAAAPAAPAAAGDGGVAEDCVWLVSHSWGTTSFEAILLMSSVCLCLVCAGLVCAYVKCVLMSSVCSWLV